MSSTSSVATLCDAIVEYLNCQEFALSFVAQRVNYWVPGDDQADLRVVVLPAAVETNGITRVEIKRRYTINVVVMQTGCEFDVVKQDMAIALAEEIENRLYGRTMADYSFEDFARGGRPIFDNVYFEKHGAVACIIPIDYLGQ